MDVPAKASKKAIEDLKFDLMRANDRLDEAQAEVDWLEGEIARMRSIVNAGGGDDWQIVAINVTPEMQALAEQARGKQWHEVRAINNQYEHIAVENAVFAPIQQGGA